MIRYLSKAQLRPKLLKYDQALVLQVLLDHIHLIRDAWLRKFIKGKTFF